MSNVEQIVKGIKETICDVCNLEFDKVNWDLDGSLFNTYSIDSILLIDLLLALEQKLDVTINPDLLNPEDLDSIRSLSEFVFKQLQEG